MNKYIFRNAKEVLLVNILAAAAAGFAALLPYITAELVERIGAFSGGTAVRFAMYYIGAVVGILVFEYLGKLADAGLKKMMMYQMKCDVAGRFLSMSQAAFHEQDSAYYMSVLTEDIPTLYQDYFMCVFDSLSSVVRVVVYLVFMFLLNPILAAVILVVCLATVAIPNIGGKRLASLRNEQAKKNARYIGRIKELFEGFILVNSVTRKAFAGQHDEACENREEAAYHYNRFGSFVEVFAGMSLYIINIAAFAGGLILIQHDLLSVGSFVGLIAFVDMIALLRALNRECDVLFCDEMFSALDEQNKKKISEYLFGRKDLTILSVTHDISKEALQFYDEIIVMDSGRIVRQGETEEMLGFLKDFFREEAS